MSVTRKGIVLAGGSGTRLHPITRAVSKQLIPIYDKPMIYYPLSTLLMAGISEILIITTEDERASFERLLGDGTQWGISLEYAVQARPEGIAQAFLVGKKFIGESPVALVLGDNIFYGVGFRAVLAEANQQADGATIFGYHVTDPQRYGIVEFDGTGKAISLEEKPSAPKSNFAVPGLYFYDNQVVEIASQLTPSDRGELEITDVNNEYLRRGELRVKLFSRGFAWLDTGTKDSLLDACNFMAAVEKRQGLKIACLEEIAFEMGLISRDKLITIAKTHAGDYGTYLQNLAKTRFSGC